MEEPFIMPADVFDAIDFVSEVEGGLMSGVMYEDDGRCGCPVGAAHFAGVIGGSVDDLYRTALQAVQELRMPHYSRFDRAHGRIARSPYRRLPWTVVAQEANIIRGT